MAKEFLIKLKNGRTVIAYELTEGEYLSIVGHIFEEGIEHKIEIEQIWSLYDAMLDLFPKK